MVEGRIRNEEKKEEWKEEGNKSEKCDRVWYRGAE